MSSKWRWYLCLVSVVLSLPISQLQSQEPTPATRSVLKKQELTPAQQEQVRQAIVQRIQLQDDADSTTDIDVEHIKAPPVRSGATIQVIEQPRPAPQIIIQRHGDVQQQQVQYQQPQYQQPQVQYQQPQPQVVYQQVPQQLPPYLQYKLWFHSHYREVRGPVRRFFVGPYVRRGPGDPSAFLYHQYMGR